MAPCVRFLQCGGFRFDSPSWDGPEGWTDLRNQELWQTFQAVLSLCQTEKIEFLFITGDLFEQEYVRKETVERVAGLFAKLEGTKIFITPGRRDPLIRTSAYRLVVWPSNVHIFSSGVSSIRIPSHNITVSGAGWTAYHQDKSFLKGFKTTGDGTLQLMLLHAEVESEKTTEGFIPIRQDEIASSGLVYLALGHQDVYSGIQKAGSTFWADCGAPEARSFHNTDPQGVLIGEIENESTRFEFRELGQRLYIEKNLTIQSPAALNTKSSGRAPVAKDNERYSNLSHIFADKLQKRRAGVEDSEDHEYWELARKIGLAALRQGRVNDSLPLTSRKGLVEVWMSGESFPFHIRYELIQARDEWQGLTTLMDHSGEPICLPEAVTLGEYLFKVQPQNFLQGGIVEWPESDDQNEFSRRVRNLRQGGEEGLSLAKVRAAIAGAQKRVNDQEKSMTYVKAEYDALRHEWETAYHEQEDERLLQIEIKNLQETNTLLGEKIRATVNLQERLDFFAQNPDYRDLRHLQDELGRLEERKQSLNANLMAISCKPYIDQAVIDSLHEECIEWACLQKKISHIAGKTKMQAKEIDELKSLLQTKGYQQFAEDEDQLLKRALKERDVAQEKLNELISTKRDFDKLQSIYSQESARFADLAVMADVTEDDEVQLAQKEKHLERWRSSNVGRTLDRTLRNRLGVTSVTGMLSARLIHYYNNHHVSNYAEFKSQLEEFREQRKRLNKVKSQMERLQEKMSQEEKLHRIVNSRNERLGQAFVAVQVANFSEWLKGWEEYQRKKHKLSTALNELHLEQQRQSREEKKLAECAEQLRNELETWGIPTTDREEALAAILNVANQLWEKDETEREVAVLSESFHRLLGNRNIKQLAEALEPIAELEREKHLSNEERQAEIAAWQKEQVENRQLLVLAQQRLQSYHKSHLMTDLEKKIEPLKKQWIAYENLRHVLEDVQTLLELSWQEWQTKYEKTLNEEKQWIFEQSFSSNPKAREGDFASKQDYFSYRMAVAHLALQNNTEAPLVFFVGKIKNEDQNFWEEVTQYLRKLSLSKQVIFCTTDSRLGEKLLENDWTLLDFSKAPRLT